MKRILLVVCTSLIALPAQAWWPQGHSIITEASVRALPSEVPAFFRNGAASTAHYAQDPDVHKNRPMPHVTDREAPEHYIDWEMLRGKKLPQTRSEFVTMCARSNLNPQNVGYAPYAIAEWTERLALGFAEHRKYPRNRDIQNKCLVYAGFLAHYAEDLCMPLHATIHHDGMAKADGSSPRTGIHARIDSLPEKLNLRPVELAQGLKVQAPTLLMPAIEQQIANSRAKISLAYRLEKQLPPESGAWKSSKAVAAFATERSREAARFTSSLMLWAWRESARVKLPEWLKREPVTSTNR